MDIRQGASHCPEWILINNSAVECSRELHHKKKCYAYVMYDHFNGTVMAKISWMRPKVKK